MASVVARFRDDFKEKGIAVDITNKMYCDFGMDLSELSRLTGVDMTILNSYDSWYILDDVFYFFKQNYIFEELFMSELVRKCNVRSVEYKPAFDDDMIGIISKCYIIKDKEYLFYTDFCLKYFHFIPLSLGEFNEAAYLVFGEKKAKKLMEDIYGLISFDMFSGQIDRFEYNLFFECDENEVRLAMLCDNGLSIRKKLIYESPFGDLALSSVGNIIDKRTSMARDDLRLLLQNERRFYYRLSILLDINVSKVLKRTLSKYRIVMENEEQKRILNFFDDKKYDIEHTLKLCRKNR